MERQPVLQPQVAGQPIAKYVTVLLALLLALPAQFYLGQGSKTSIFSTNAQVGETIKSQTWSEWWDEFNEWLDEASSYNLLIL